MLVDPDLILEGDLLLCSSRLQKEEWRAVAYERLKEHHFRNPLMRRLFLEGEKRHRAKSLFLCLRWPIILMMKKRRPFFLN